MSSAGDSDKTSELGLSCGVVTCECDVIEAEGEKRSEGQNYTPFVKTVLRNFVFCFSRDRRVETFRNI